MVMDRVVIGMEPHKQSVTIEARDNPARCCARPGPAGGHGRRRRMLTVAHQWPERVWVVEGANGVGRPIAQRLLADGEQVLDVPAGPGRHPGRLFHPAQPT
jgi:hypothetical protein